MNCKLCDFKCSEKFSNKALKHNNDIIKRTKISLKTQLSIHILSIHNISIGQYVILTEYNGVNPKCFCNMCNELPVFKRGKFLKYALGHSSFKFKEIKYIEKFGIPTCLYCKINNVEFHRGIPNKFCTPKCSGLNSGGFTKQNVQEKIKNNIFNKYGVKNISQIPEVRKKLLKIRGPLHHLFGRSLSKSWRLNIGKSISKRWKNLAYRLKIIKAIKKSLNTPEIKKFRSNLLKQRISDGYILGRTSLLHLRISKLLNLKDLGFISEKRVLNYFADELNTEKKIIVEINGDYVHANPNKYLADDIIIIGKQRYLASEKWKSDKIRKENIEKSGYKIFVIWESDNFNEKKKELLKLL